MIDFFEKERKVKLESWVVLLNRSLNMFSNPGVVITETGLPGAMFAYLDIERDLTALSYARDTLTCCLLSAASARSIRDWLALAKRVLTVRSGEYI